MMRNLMGFYDAATHAVEASSNQITWAKIREQLPDLLHKLSSMKFEVGCGGERWRDMDISF